MSDEVRSVEVRDAPPLAARTFSAFPPTGPSAHTSPSSSSTSENTTELPLSHHVSEDNGAIQCTGMRADELPQYWLSRAQQVRAQRITLRLTPGGASYRLQRTQPHALPRSRLRVDFEHLYLFPLQSSLLNAHHPQGSFE
jgi:hypothetical protein